MAPSAPKRVHPEPRCTARPPFSVEVPGVEAAEGETVPRRHPECLEELASLPAPGITTTFELVKASAEKYGAAPALGWRRLVQTHHEIKKVPRMVDGQVRHEDKKWSIYEFAAPEHVSFSDYFRLALSVGSGLRALGLAAGDRVHLYAATSHRWLAVAHGAASQSMPVVTAYDTLGADGLRHSMLATGARLVFLDPPLLATLGSVLGDTADVRFVVWNAQHHAVDDDLVGRMREAHPSVTFMSFDDLVGRGEAEPADPVPPSTDDLCCIMYTSGSTGDPKGVPLRHRNVVAAVAGVSVVVGRHLGPGDVFLTYLPLAHILEFVFEHSSLHWGAAMGYGNPKTLSDASVRNCPGDIRAFRPTILAGVPAVWETMRKGIEAKVAAGSPLVQRMFWGSMWLKSTLMGAGLPGSGLLDAVVFRKVRDATGGRLRLCLNGGGPIAPETQRFVSMVMCPMISGYGLTETCAMGTLQNPLEWTVSSIGAMPGSIEIKLVDHAEAGYRVTNRPLAQGEVLIRGNSVMEGYYRNEKETEAAMTPDGWFRTGDVGEFDANGHLRLVDRKKNLIKTLNGEYIALEKLESVYRAAPVVANICVYADDRRAKPVAIIVPAEPVLRKVAAAAHADSGSGSAPAPDAPLEQLVHDKTVVAAVLRDLQAAGRARRLAGIEILEGVVMSAEEWTPQNGFVTAAQKLNRRKIVSTFRADIDAVYGITA